MPSLFAEPVVSVSATVIVKPPTSSRRRVTFRPTFSRM
jgi:hypothetical protein